MTTLTKKGNDGHLYWLDLLKVFATMSMVMLHVSADYLTNLHPTETTWQIANIYNSISRFCVPVFVMISGALFLGKDRNMSQYIKRIIIALVIWSLLYASYAFAIEKLKNPNISWGRLIELAYSPSHLWFLYMLAGLYAVTPILRRIIIERSAAKLFIEIWLIFSVGLPAIAKIPVLTHPIVTVAEQIHLGICLEYTGYYVLGFYLMTFKSARFVEYLIPTIVVPVVITVIGTYYISLNHGHISQLFYDNLFPTTVLVSIGLFLFFKEKAESLFLFSKPGYKAVEFLASSSLGIYLVHMFVLRICLKFSDLSIIGGVIIPLISVFIFSISATIVFFLKKGFPSFGKYL